MSRLTKTALAAIYQRLFNAFGPQKWWPAKPRFEVIVGAILTQNTNWGNVEKALNNLKKEKLLSPRAIRHIPLQKLSSLIKPAGYFNVKAKRLKNFIVFLFSEYNGRLKNMEKEDVQLLRRKLLNVNGIGPETADSILLYAFDKPVFVVDAYTKRILYRHNLAEQTDDYHTIQEMFKGALTHNTRMFNEYHALIVHLGKNFCKTKPNCRQCLLKDFRYSLKYKCSNCHRALPEKSDRRKNKKGYFCRACCTK